MESTIEELVDNLEYEKRLNKKEKEEIEEILRTAANVIEPDGIAEFVKAIRRKVDAPASNIFTEKGVNVESLKSEAKIEAKIVIKLQVEKNQKLQQENKGQQGDVIIGLDENKEKENEKATEEYKEKIISENKDYLDKYMPYLEESSKNRLAQNMQKAQEFVDEFSKRVKNGENPDKVREEMSREKDETAADVDIRELGTAINMLRIFEKQPNPMQQEGGFESVENHGDIADMFATLSDNGRGETKTAPTTKEEAQDLVYKKATNAIETIRNEIIELQAEIQKQLAQNDYTHHLIALYEKLDERYLDLRAAIQTQEQYRADRGEQDVVDRKRTERKQLIESVKQQYLTAGNKQSLVEIFEEKKKDAAKQGIDLEEMIGFEDILESVKQELQHFPQLTLGDADTIVKNEQKNYKIYREQKVLDEVKKNVQKKIVQARLDKDPKKARDYEDIAEKHSKSGHKLTKKFENNRDVISVVKEKYNGLNGIILRRDEKLRRQKVKDFQSVDTQQMKSTEDRTEFIRNVTQLYFSSDKNVVDIYEQFKENCIRMGIKPEDIISAVSAETLNYDNSSNYITIKQFEKEILELSRSIEILNQESKQASLDGNEELANRKNKKIAEAQRTLESRKATNAAIKRAVLLNKAEQENAEDLSERKSPEMVSGTKTKEENKTTGKKGIFSFLKRKGKKLEINNGDINEEALVIKDLQRQEQRDATNDQNAYQTQGNSSPLTVSTINVDGEPSEDKKEPARGTDNGIEEK